MIRFKAWLYISNGRVYSSQMMNRRSTLGACGVHSCCGRPEALSMGMWHELFSVRLPFGHSATQSYDATVP